MRPKELARGSKPGVAPPGTATAGSPAAETTQIEQVQDAVERGAEAALRTAFDRFFDAWFDRVYAFAWRRGRDTGYAETLTTLVFMKALHLLPRGSTGARELAHRLSAEGRQTQAGERAVAREDPPPRSVSRHGRAD